MSDSPISSASRRKSRRRRLTLGILVLAGSFLLAQAAVAASPLSASGSVSGELHKGMTVQVHLVVAHAGGWQKISEVEVDLDLRGKPLEQLILDPTHVSVVLVGEGGPNAFGEQARFAGAFFELNPASIAVSAKGDRLTLAIPIRLRADPPPGARLSLTARGFDLASVGPRPLTSPVREQTGFSWGTLAAAIAGALFLGSFLGGAFASRRRPPPRPSIYGVVQRRIEEERTRT